LNVGNMMTNGLAIGFLFFCTLLVTYAALRNSRTESQNAALFKATGELRSPRWLVVLFFSMASFATIMAFALGLHRERDPTWPMALFGLAGIAFIFIRSFFALRLEPSGIRFGWRCRRYVAYADIGEVVRKSDRKDAVFTIVLRSGARHRIGSDIPCEKLFIEELERRSGCAVTYRRPGQRADKHALRSPAEVATIAAAVETDSTGERTRDV
jgi:hypothetical protein